MTAVRIPVVVTCECGRTTAGDAGGEVACGCGRRYATDLSQQQIAALHGLQQKLRVFARLGIGVVGLVALAAMLAIGPRVGLVVAAVAAVLWWGVVQAAWKRWTVARIAALPPATVRPL